MKRLVRAAFLLASLFGVIYWLNETPAFYHESMEYSVPDPKQYFSPAVAPISKSRPGHDTLIILFHGFPSSPQEFRAMADTLSLDYDVVVPLLPGFGTTHEAMRNAYFSQWLAFARDEYIKQRPKYRRVFIGGQSMGGVLALRLAQTLPVDKAPDGLVLISTPVFLNHVLGAGVLYDWRLYISRFLAWGLPEIKSAESTADQDGAVWVGFRGVKFLRQVHSLKMGMYAVRNELEHVRVPVLLMHSRGDKTVPFENIFYLGRHLGTTDIRMRVFDLRTWQHTRHVLSLYRSTQNEVLLLMREWIQDHSSVIPVAKGSK